MGQTSKEYSDEQDDYEAPLRAFPLLYQNGSVDRGMTLRDWFAGQALVGLLAANEWVHRTGAAACYEIADKMLEERDGPD